MRVDRLDFFDVLPYHPPPEPFESITGYLTRLAHSNGIKSLRAMGAMCFPDRCPQRPLPRVADFLPKSWGAFPTVTTYSEADLLATTFYYLVYKFGRCFDDKGMGQFLKNCLSDSLRYCPLCLREAAYYRLTWRFLTLSGCPTHHCQFLDRCGHCGHQLHFLSAPLAVGICRYCQGDLAYCQAKPLPEQARPTAHEHLLDLQFLLAPEPSPLIEPDFIKAIGLRLTYWRLEKGVLSAVEVARQTGLPKTTVHTLEGRNQPGTSFFRYVQYAAYLGVTLRQIFTTVLPPEVNDHNWREWARSTSWREQQPVTQDQAAAKPLQTGGKQPQQGEETLWVQIQAAVDQLKSQGEPVTQHTIRRLLASKPNLLAWPSQVEALIKQAVTETYFVHQRHLPPQQQTEQQLVTQVQAAIQELHVLNQSVTQKKIARLTGVSIHILRHYPLVREIFEQVRKDRQLARVTQVHQRDKELAEKTRQAAETLAHLDQSITKAAIGRLVGLTPAGYRCYPQARKILNQVTQR